MSATEERDCPVCYEPESAWEGSTKAKCGHAMCMQCFLEWTVVKKNMSCPMCRGNVRASRFQEPQEPQEIQPAQWLQSALYHWQQYREENDEDDYHIQALEHQEYHARREAHEARVRASAERRRVFLEQQQDLYIAHCMTCSDEACISNHVRNTRWLMGRRKLIPLPPRIKCLPRLVLGYMLGKGRGRMGVALRERIVSQITRLYGSIPDPRRITKLLNAIRDQERTKESYRSHREHSMGSVTLRLTDHAAGLPAIVAQLQTKKPEFEFSTEFPDYRPNYNVKLFRGYTPPKRRARVGDIHQKIDGVRGMCVGWNLWAYSNGSRLRLDGNRWVSC